jgi:hypothetical protein
VAVGINARGTDLVAILRELLDRVSALEQPVSIRIGSVGGTLPGAGMGYTLSVNAANELIATSDSGTVTVVALP